MPKPTRDEARHNIFLNSIELDRTHSWAQLTRACAKEAGSSVLLVCADTAQSLDIFYQRVYDAARFNDTAQQKQVPNHEVITLPLHNQGAMPSSAALWEQRLLQGLAERPGSRRASAPELLQALRAGRRPVLLRLGASVLRDPHLMAMSDAGFRSFSEGLRDFLCLRLPELTEQSAGPQPLRVLIAVSYPNRPIVETEKASSTSMPPGTRRLRFFLRESLGLRRGFEAYGSFRKPLPPLSAIDIPEPDKISVEDLCLHINHELKLFHRGQLSVDEESRLRRAFEACEVGGAHFEDFCRLCDSFLREHPSVRTP